MEHHLRDILAPPLLAISLALIFDGVRRIRIGGDAWMMIIGLTEISVPACFILGFVIALVGAPPPVLLG